MYREISTPDSGHLRSYLRPTFRKVLVLVPIFVMSGTTLATEPVPRGRTIQGQAAAQGQAGNLRSVAASRRAISRAVQPGDLVAYPGAQLSPELAQLIQQGAGTERLLKALESAHRSGQLTWARNANPWTVNSGWRWQSEQIWQLDSPQRRAWPRQNDDVIILAADGPLLVAIRHGRSLEMSIRDLSEGRAAKRGYADTPRYFGHHAGSQAHITAFNVRHLARKSPELFRFYAYFAGPNSDLPSADSLPRSPVDWISR